MSRSGRNVGHGAKASCPQNPHNPQSLLPGAPGRSPAKRSSIGGEDRLPAAHATASASASKPPHRRIADRPRRRALVRRRGRSRRPLPRHVSEPLESDRNSPVRLPARINRGGAASFPIGKRTCPRSSRRERNGGERYLNSTCRLPDYERGLARVAALSTWAPLLCRSRTVQGGGLEPPPRSWGGPVWARLRIANGGR
jgi:hypothetical protein